tara:strand:- start:17473 stop:17802 length:330 start_codon:yes stop_codon:yes gene_type:complete
MNKAIEKNGIPEFNSLRDSSAGVNIGVGLVPSKSVFNGIIIDTLKIENRLFEVTFQGGEWFGCTGHDGTQALWEPVMNSDAILEIIESTQEGMHYANKYFGIYCGITIH